MDTPIKEFKIENLSQTAAVLDAIKANFVKEQAEQESVIVRYDDKISVEDLLGSLKQLWKYETDTEYCFDILIKNLSYEHRKAALGQALQTEDIKDPIFLSNIYCLLKGYNTFENVYFEHEQVFLNDEVEFLDIFDDLEAEIKTATHKLAEYYVSMIKTCNLVEGVENNPNAVEMEYLYKYMFSCMDVTILARVLSSIKDPAIWETKKIVLNSLGYLGAVAEKFVFTNSIIDLFGSALLKETVDAVVNKQE